MDRPAMDVECQVDAEPLEWGIRICGGWMSLDVEKPHEPRWVDLDEERQWQLREGD